MLCFDLIHTYSSDTLAQGILKACFAFTNVLMSLPRFEPVAPNRQGLSGKHSMRSPNYLSNVCTNVILSTVMYVCVFLYMYICNFK